MSNPVTDLRKAIVALLRATYPDADVQGSERRDGLSRDKDVIRVYWTSTAEVGADVSFVMPLLKIEWWKPQPKTMLAPELDDEPLEQAAWDLAELLEPVSSGPSRLVPALTFRLTRVQPVRDEYAIEAFLLVYSRNPATIGAAGG